MDQSDARVDPQSGDIDDIQDDQDIQRYSKRIMNLRNDYDYLLQNLCNKFDIKNYKTMQKRALNSLILKKVDESTKDSTKIKEEIRDLLKSEIVDLRQGSTAQIERLEQERDRANQEKQNLTDENQSLRQRVQTLENEIENAKQNLTLSIQDLKLHIENKPQIFSQDELENLTSDLALRQPPAKDIELITFNQLEKKIIVQYRMNHDIANLAPARVEEQVIPQQFFDQVWTAFSDLCNKLAHQTGIALNLIQKLANFIQTENNKEEANIAAVQEAIQQKQARANQLLADKPEHYVFSEIQKILEAFTRENLLEYDSINQPTSEIYQRLLDQNQEIITNYEQIILQYIRTE